MADRRLQVFHTVAKQLSFTKAAELLFMTQPAVTFQIKQLEEHFNTRLFERSHGKISLTVSGNQVLSFAERILDLSGELETRMSEATSVVGGLLLLGASTTIAEFMLPKILGEFKTKYPRVQTHMMVANSEAIEHKVAENNLDIGLVESPSHRQSLYTEACCEDEMVMICAPSFNLKNKESITAQDLASHAYVCREQGSGTREFADEYFKRSHVSTDNLNVVMELGSPEAVKGVVETGLGYSIISQMSVTKELKLKTLIAVPLQPKLIRIMSLVYPKEKFRSRLLSTFIDFAKKKMKEYPNPRQ